jgi:hypothetical protein
VAQLGLKILAIVEPALLEERSPDPSPRFSIDPFWLARRGQHTSAVSPSSKRRVGKNRIPFGHLASVLIGRRRYRTAMRPSSRLMKTGSLKYSTTFKQSPHRGPNKEVSVGLSVWVDAEAGA